MTLETALVSEQDAQVVIEPVGSWKQKMGPWLVWGIGAFCMMQGLRLLWMSDSIGFLAGLGLLMPVPSCLYLGWRERRKHDRVRVTMPSGQVICTPVVQKQAAA